MNIKQLDSLALLLLVFVAPWTILALSTELLFPYVTSKVFLFRSVVELAFGLWLVRILIDRNYRIRIHHPLVLVMTAFVAWVLVSNNLGISPYRSFWSNYERMEGGLMLLHYYAFFLILISTLRSDARRFAYVLNIIAVMSVVGVLGLSESGRADSVLGNPIYLGNLAVMGFFLSAFWVSSFKGFSLHRLIAFEYWALFAVFFLAVLVASATRGAALGLLLGLAASLTALVAVAKWGKRRKLIGLGVAYLAVALGSGAFIAGVDAIKQSELVESNPLLKRITDISLNDQTTADRIENWRIALNASSQRPLLGWGQENYDSAFLEHYQPLVMDQAKVWFDRAHNVYLDWLVSSGVPGLLLFLLIWALALIYLWRIKVWSGVQKSAITGLIAAYLAKNGVGFDSFSDWLVMISILAMIVSAGIERTPRCDQDGSYYWAYLLALVLSVTAIYQFNIKPVHANRDVLMASRVFKHAADPNYLHQCLAKPNEQTLSGQRYCELMSGFGIEQSKRFRPVKALLNRAGLVYPPGQSEAFQLFVGQVTQASLINAEPSSEELVEGLISMAQSQLRWAPNNWRLWFNLAVLYSDIGQHELAVHTLRRVVSAAPSKTIFWLTLAKVYVRMGQFEAAKDAYNLAYGLNSQHQSIKQVYDLVKQGYEGNYIFKPGG